jgi:uncharacterized protein (TIGR04222 family)
MDIFNLRGPEFLDFYLMTMAIAVSVSLIWRWAMMGLFLGPPEPAQLDPFETAYLAGGKAGLANAALASLVHRKIALITTNGHIAVNTADAPDLHPVERQMLGKMSPDSRYSVVKCRGLVDGQRIREKLESKGLAATFAQRRNAAAIPVILMSILLLTGVIKIFIGISRDKPVGFLVLLSIATAGLLIFFCLPRPRTWQGSRALRDIRAANASLHSTATTSLATLSAADVAFALALWGPTILTGSPLRALRDVLMPASTASGGVNGSSGCGGGGCGGGGCGGCGGG